MNFIFFLNSYSRISYNLLFIFIFQETTAENISHLLAVSHRAMLLRTIATRSLKISRPTVTNRLVRPRQCPEVEGITLAKVIHQQEEARPPLTLDETNNTMMITSEVVEVHAVDVAVAILIVNQIVDLEAVQIK